MKDIVVFICVLQGVLFGIYFTSNRAWDLWQVLIPTLVLGVIGVIMVTFSFILVLKGKAPLEKRQPND